MIAPAYFHLCTAPKSLRAAARCALVIFGISLPDPASAQTSVPIRQPTALPEGPDIERRIPPRPPEPRPQALPPQETPPQPPAPVPADPATDTFVVAAIVIEGATIFETDRFVPFYRDLLARRIDRQDLAILAEAITNLYYEAGYTLTRAYVPPQDVEAGVITVHVAEGYVERVVLEGAAEPPAIMAETAAAITIERPLRRSTLERQMLLLGDLFGARIEDARLRPIDAAAGRYELVVDLRQRSFDYYGSLDNRGTRSSGPWQLWNSVGLNSLAAAGWRAQGAFFTAPNSTQELRYAQAMIARTLGSDGTVIRTTISASDNVAGKPGKSSETETASQRLQLGLTHPIQRSRAGSLWATLSFDALHSREDRFKNRVFEDDLRVIRPSAYYFFADGWQGENGLNGEISLGLTTLGASHSGPERSRADADTSFRKLRVDGWRSQGLFGSWSLYAQVAAQVSDRPLLASEEFALGGSRFGRGYDAAIISGDRGRAASLELRLTEPLEGRLREYQLYGFYDVGKIRNGNVDGNARHRLASTGLGARLTFAPAIRTGLELAKPLNAVEGREDRETRTFFTLTAEF